MFYDMEGAFVGQEISHEDFVRLVKEEKFIEIWNDVFMEYEKKMGRWLENLLRRMLILVQDLNVSLRLCRVRILRMTLLIF
jgi:alanyl-tRNA synthetase